MVNIEGIAASAGIAIAKAFVIEQPNLQVEKWTIDDADGEMFRFHEALAQSIVDVQALKQRTLEQLGEEKAEIFESHLLVLNDPELIGPIERLIREEQVNAEHALQETAKFFIAMFENMQSAYLRERASDMRDVSKRVLGHLLKVKAENLGSILDEVVLVAEDLTPSDTAQLNRNYVLGFITNIGGRTTHSAIMARSLEIPAVVGTKGAALQIRSGDLLILDGLEGIVIINPDEQTVEQYRIKQGQYEEQRNEWAKLKNKPTVTADGHHVELAANIGTRGRIRCPLKRRRSGRAVPDRISVYEPGQHAIGE